MAVIAPSFRSFDSNSFSGSASVTVGKPTGTAEGDLLLLFGGHNGGAMFANPPASGWTELYTSEFYPGELWWKLAGASEPSSYTFDMSESGEGIVVVAAYKDVYGANPIAQAGDGETLTNTTTWKGLSVTTTETNELIVALGVGGYNQNSTPPSGMTERFDVGAVILGGTGYVKITGADVVQASAGATGDKLGSWATTPGWTEGRLLALQGVPPVAHQGEATLQSVFSRSAEAVIGSKGEATLPSVFGVAAEAFGAPATDFTKYDLYLDDGTNSKGFLGYRDEALKPSTASVKLQPVRQDVGNNPIEMRPESGDMFGQEDFSHGALQLFFHRSNRDPKRFWASEGFDISEPGKLVHLKQVQEAYDNTSVTVLAQSGGVLFAAKGSKVQKSNGAIPGTWTTEEDPQSGGTDTVEDLASCGDILYGALGANGIHKRVAAGTWSHFSDLAATRVAWVKDRLMAASSTVIAEINVGTGASTTLETFQSGWTCEEIFEAGGFFHAVMRSDAEDMSRVHHYGLSSTGTLEKKGSTPFPQGQQLYSGAGYLNVAYVGGGKRNASGGYDPILYQCSIDSDNGFLNYIKIAEEVGSGSSSYPVRAICPLGEAVLFGWSLTSSSKGGAARDGLAIHHLGRDAFAHHLKKASATGKNVRSIIVYKGTVFFTLLSDGIFCEDASKYVAEASLISSAADWGNAGRKAWDLIQLAHKALPSASASVKAQYSTSLPEGATWIDGVTSAGSGSEGTEGTISNVLSRHLSVKLISTATTGEASAPEILSFSVRSNPTTPATGKPEFTLTRFLRLAPVDKRDPEAQEIYQDPWELREWLQGLVHKWVRVYEPGVTWLVRVTDVSDIHPEQPWFTVTSGETGRDFYIIQIQLRGTR